MSVVLFHLHHQRTWILAVATVMGTLQYKWQVRSSSRCTIIIDHSRFEPTSHHTHISYVLRISCHPSCTGLMNQISWNYHCVLFVLFSCHEWHLSSALLLSQASTYCKAASKRTASARHREASTWRPARNVLAHSTERDVILWGHWSAQVVMWGPACFSIHVWRRLVGHKSSSFGKCAQHQQLQARSPSNEFTGMVTPAQHIAAKCLQGRHDSLTVHGTSALAVSSSWVFAPARTPRQEPHSWIKRLTASKPM